MDRVKDPADPDRCQGRTSQGQCWYKAAECRLHRGHIKTAEEDLRQYRLTNARHREKLDLLKTSDPVYALTEALSMVHLLVEKRMNLAAESPDLFRDHGIINTLHRTTERLSKSLTSIEERLKTLKGKSVIYQQAQLMIQACDEELKDSPDREVLLEVIKQRMLKTIYGTSNLGITDDKAMEVPAQGWRPAKGQTMFDITNPADRDRIAQLARNSDLKRLAEAIGVQFVIVEELWNGCNGNDMHLIQCASEINGHLRTLADLVKSAHSIEETLGNLLSQETRMNLGQRLGDILVDELEHISGFEVIVDRIWQRTEVLCRQQLTAQKRLKG